VQQLATLFRHIGLDEQTFRGRGHVRLAQLQHLMRTGQVDEQLFWTEPASAPAGQIEPRPAVPRQSVALPEGRTPAVR
jgi:hypothetical protein